LKPKIDLAEILSAHKGERHLVVLHEFPDPDAIAAAYVHQLISEQFDIGVDILYKGEISHPQNIALVHLLGLDLIEYKPGFDFAPYQAAVFIDNQGTTVEDIVAALVKAGVPLLLIVDHHQLQDKLEPQYSDIQTIGATSSIYTAYLEAGVVEWDSVHKEHVLASTALVHGILTDTEGFVRASAQDLYAAAYLSRFRDPELLNQVLRQSRRKQTMDIIQRALGDRVIQEGFSIAGIGYIRLEDRDAIPQAADFLITEENVFSAIVYGIMANGDKQETLVGSLRTSKITLNPDDFIKEVFGKSEDGRYFGGGREMAGGFAIPIGFLSGGPNGEHQVRKWEVYDAQVKEKIFTKLGVEH
jgi:nanoRNase/pAp phosphatase (c-di-AMP/oligoRNAs hydrolase)